ncbi:MAG TPA: MerR family transcriptional regulator [Solirubrobacterales bacterium]|nr:MerR family transcriptional regulator [Solirubrobacterales bacterium]
MKDVRESPRDQRNGNAASMTIDELARRTGMTVRNIRAHQSRGLVPPPEVRGRTGFYGDDHVSRIELIQELQADGFNLESIRKLLEGAGGSSSEVLNFSRTLRAPFEDEQPEILDEQEMAERWGGPLDARLMARTEKLGLLRDLGDGRYEILSPRLQRAGLELAELGVPPEVALEVVSQVRTSARRVARVFIELFLENVWKPFNEAGRPEEEWPKVRDALERLRPLASEALLVIFQQVMSETVEEVTGREIQRGLTAPSGGSGRSRRRRGRSSSSRSRRRRV